jgi:hypothetical protein
MCGLSRALTAASIQFAGDPDTVCAGRDRPVAGASLVTEAKKRSRLEEQLGEELIYAIGMLFASAGMAEHAIALQFVRLMAHPNKIDPAIVATLGRTDTRARLQQIKIIARFRLSPEKAQEVIKLCSKIQDNFDRRNELAHWVVAPGMTANQAVLKTIRIKEDGSLDPPKPVTIQQIRELAEKLSARLNALDRLLTESGMAKLDERDFVQSGALPPSS